MSASLIGHLGQALSDYPPLQCRCRSRARASLGFDDEATRHCSQHQHPLISPGSILASAVVLLSRRVSPVLGCVMRRAWCLRGAKLGVPVIESKTAKILGL